MLTMLVHVGSQYRPAPQPLARPSRCFDILPCFNTILLNMHTHTHTISTTASTHSNKVVTASC
jgi:hypothetical protein